MRIIVLSKKQQFRKFPVLPTGLLTKVSVVFFAVALLGTAGATAVPAGEPAVGVERLIRFARDVRPILSEACFTCHGPDPAKRQADLRVDTQEGLLGSAVSVVVPGNAKASELYRRITTDNPQDRMPPPVSHLTLTGRQIEIVRQWIDQGALWEPHWSFVAPSCPEMRGASGLDWPRNAIDGFLLERMKQEQLSPSSEADGITLFRRVALDLVGIPPRSEEVDEFLADVSPDAYERQVDRLLASPHYGERMAVCWLDGARYSDTDGYQDDEPRTMWRWREWVIDAFNDNQPFDEFTRDQIAGDLVPNPRPEQILATGFHRNNRTNGEGGSIDEEFRVEYIADRVITLCTVWLGLTMECARCHDHKYDEFTQVDFYRLFAYFNETAEPGVYRRSAPPTIKVPSRSLQQQLNALDRQRDALPKSIPESEVLQKAREELWKGVPETMCLQDGTWRESFVLLRGQYDMQGAVVTAGLPASLRPPKPALPPNRLGLAEWLTDPENPLVARVAINRLWHIQFRQWLVETPEDFGSQGELPTHPELLDWLSMEYVRLGWNTKAIQRRIACSATYRQSSKSSPEMLEQDPTNRFLARCRRERLSAETLRDQTLAVSGLLVTTLGGPSVKPFQPEGLWQDLASGSSSAYRDGYQADQGPGRYRRSLYGFLRRTIPPPGMSLFDAPDREVCVVRRASTNTPLQALAIMNDETYLDAARLLAFRTLSADGFDLETRTRFLFKTVTCRNPRTPELQSLMSGWHEYHASFQAAPDQASLFMQSGAIRLPEDYDPVELASFTVLANVILNLDEVVTRE